MELPLEDASEELQQHWVSDVQRSFASARWPIKVLWSISLIIVGTVWSVAMLLFSIPFMTPIWVVWWQTDNPVLWKFYPGLGFFMIWTTLFFTGWVDLSLHERRHWSRLKLAWLAARAVILTSAAFHIIMAGVILITIDYFWLGTLIFFLGEVLLVQPSVSLRYSWMWTLFPEDHVTTRNDRLAYIALAFIGGILVFLFSLMGANWG